jgi:hypothetical protein
MTVAAWLFPFRSARQPFPLPKCNFFLLVFEILNCYNLDTFSPNNWLLKRQTFVRRETKVMSLHAFGSAQIAKLPVIFYRSQFRFFCVKGGASNLLAYPTFKQTYVSRYSRVQV